MLNKKNITHRLSIIEGQIRGVKKMIEEDKDCKSIVTQITAIKSAIDNTLSIILTENLHTCLKSKIQDNEDVDVAIKEAIDMLTKSLK